MLISELLSDSPYEVIDYLESILAKMIRFGKQFYF